MIIINYEIENRLTVEIWEEREGEKCRRVRKGRGERESENREEEGIEAQGERGKSKREKE